MGRRNETREVVDTAKGKRLKVVHTRTDERLMDEAQVQAAIENIDNRIARMEAELVDLRAARDDLAAKKPQLKEA
ncbi:MAG TPA: hypothetical protein VM238_02695 [Phycisphaerae bacterium]|nr:hypothetical protein [Phycisphaerae bacterium]